MMNISLEVITVEIMFVHPISAIWQTLTLKPIGKNTKPEQSVPINIMLKAQIEIMTSLQGIL